MLPLRCALRYEPIGHEERDGSHRDPDARHLGAGLVVGGDTELEGGGRDEGPGAERGDQSDELIGYREPDREERAEYQRRLAEQPPESGLEHRLRLTVASDVAGRIPREGAGHSRPFLGAGSLYRRFTRLPYN